MGRRSGIPRSARLRPHCRDGNVGVALHMVFECSFLQPLRVQYANLFSTCFLLYCPIYILPWFPATYQASLRFCPRAKLTIKHIRLTAQLVYPMWGPFTFRGRTSFSEVAIVLTSLFSLVLIPQFDGWPVAHCVDSIKQMYLNVALPGLLNRYQRLS